MTLVSRDQMPPRTPYEGELRERLARADQQAEMFRRLAAAQDHVVAAARAVQEYVLAVGSLQGAPSVVRLREALAALDAETGKILLDSMPAELRAALTGPSVIEGAFTEPLFPGLIYGETPERAYVVVAIQSRPGGEERWDFDSAQTFDEAFEKLRRWSDRAAREWPDVRFTLKAPAGSDADGAP